MVISNCVINLAADKPAVFGEIARVLKPGGRMGVSDIVADDSLTPAERAERGSYVGCIAGALSFSEYEAGLTRRRIGRHLGDVDPRGCGRHAQRHHQGHQADGCHAIGSHIRPGRAHLGRHRVLRRGRLLLTFAA